MIPYFRNELASASIRSLSVTRHTSSQTIYQTDAKRIDSSRTLRVESLAEIDDEVTFAIVHRLVFCWFRTAANRAHSPDFSSTIQSNRKTICLFSSFLFGAVRHLNGVDRPALNLNVYHFLGAINRLVLWVMRTRNIYFDAARRPLFPFPRNVFFFFLFATSRLGAQMRMLLQLRRKFRYLKLEQC